MLFSHGFLACGVSSSWGQECEPAVGRLLVFSVDGQGAERRVTLVAEEETRGAVNVLNAFNGKLLAGINSKVSGVVFPTLPDPTLNRVAAFTFLDIRPLLSEGYTHTRHSSITTPVHFA